ncbi:hypothetical protein DL93DRAFT_1921133 [Clavulina sp. PMI_390]|nr:hypothetical protein DL93DRAFT_1921133 [Clavulina sp. PMI_390]
MERSQSYQRLINLIHQTEIQTSIPGKLPSWIKNVVALYPYDGPTNTDGWETRREDKLAAGVFSEVYGGQSAVGYSPVIPRDELDPIARLWTPDTLVSQQFSIYLLRLFLPYRSHCHFYMDLNYFFRCAFLPPDDPEALHPGLLYAIYQAACIFADGPLRALHPCFLSLAQQYLALSLAEADRLTHYLWAQIILGACFTCRGRSKEAYLAITGAARLALACGLGVVEDPMTGGRRSISVVENAEMPLLQPPRNKAEESDRWNLAQSVYMVDRAMAMITGFPSVFVTSTEAIGLGELLGKGSTASTPGSSLSLDRRLSSNGSASPGETPGSGSDTGSSPTTQVDAPSNNVCVSSTF